MAATQSDAPSIATIGNSSAVDDVSRCSSARAIGNARESAGKAQRRRKQKKKVSRYANVCARGYRTTKNLNADVCAHVGSLALCVRVDSVCVPKMITRAKAAPNRRRVSMTGDERKLMQFYLLQSAFSSEDDKIDETSWVTSTLMDLILWRLANLYPIVHFLPTDFFHCYLESVSRNHHHSQHSHQLQQQPHAAFVVDKANPASDFHVRDVLGRVIDYTSDRPILFAVNSGLIHWNLFRVQLTPYPELQLFEPMGYASTGICLSSRMHFARGS